MSGTETNILSCHVRYLIFRIRKGWNRPWTPASARTGGFELAGVPVVQRGSPAAGTGRWARANCGRPSVAWSSTRGRRSLMSASAGSGASTLRID